MKLNKNGSFKFLIDTSIPVDFTSDSFETFAGFMFDHSFLP